MLKSRTPVSTERSPRAEPIYQGKLRELSTFLHEAQRLHPGLHVRKKGNGHFSWHGQGNLRLVLVLQINRTFQEYFLAYSVAYVDMVGRLLDSRRVSEIQYRNFHSATDSAARASLDQSITILAPSIPAKSSQGSQSNDVMMRELALTSLIVAAHLVVGRLIGGSVKQDVQNDGKFTFRR